MKKSKVFLILLSAIWIITYPPFIKIMQIDFFNSKHCIIYLIVIWTLEWIILS